ncbi:DUF2026 family protein, partial [Halochromatium glycolicum]|uniref:DUF2026 family protein n=1 Tax=Halochromatium glycolicum TaxID=85075 RepID=UPI001909AA27
LGSGGWPILTGSGLAPGGPQQGVSDSLIRSLSSSPSRLCLAQRSCDQGHTMVLGKTNENGELTASSAGFHCWVEVEDWVIDFQVPLFPDLGSSFGHVIPKERKMLQKRKELLARKIEDLKNPGEAMYIQDEELTEYYIAHQSDFEFNKDLEKIAVQWFRPVPKKMVPKIGMQDQHGAVRPVSISSTTLVGAW